MSSELALRAFEADASFSAALAAFQAEVAPGTNPVQAARAATAHGFSWLARPSGPGLIEVRLRHSGGADAAAEGTSVTALLGGLLGLSAGEAEAAALAGLPLQQEAQAPEPGKKCENRIKQPQPDADAPEPAQAAAESLAAATSGTVVAEPVTDPEPDPTTPLTAEQKACAVNMIKSLTADQRQAFTISFRDAFRVDRSVKAIAPVISELRHLHFCDRWSVEAAGGIAP